MFIGIYFAGGKGTWKTMATRAKVQYGGIRLKRCMMMPIAPVLGN